ncbi:hypothetical protein HYALB_00001945 [Hymenoscyphus albidus]|uniref:Uncharacterized protein n=1 Tax=Hymenoscyphus albidus TaxID=595503 RepID=A0A9N9Q1M6_9HELO|nr:hypothetical protein HYALB_00001945 [Hymenoscyphus albidus]
MAFGKEWGRNMEALRACVEISLHPYEAIRLVFVGRQGYFYGNAQYIVLDKPQERFANTSNPFSAMFII